MARKRIESINIEHLPDDDPDTSYLEQDGWEKRLAAYQRGAFGYIGIRAKAEISIDDTLQTVHSGGLWGIEDDNDRDHLEEIEHEQTRELYDQLVALLSKRIVDRDWHRARTS